MKKNKTILNLEMDNAESLQLLGKNKWLIIITMIAILLVNNWSIPLWDQDEAAYAGFGYNMIESGNWLVPNFMFSDVHRKPPLHFWNIALSYKLFGYNEFAVRFPSFLAILGTFMLMFFQGRKILSSENAFRGLVVLAGSFLVTTIAKVSVTDSTVLFTSTLCAFGIINTLRNPNWQWIGLFWVGFALGILTKGPPIIIFSGAFVGILFIVHPLRRNLLKLHPWFFLPLALAPTFLWGYLTYLEDNGKFLAWMYDWYVLQRINGGVFGQTGPVGSHLIAMTLFFLPFLLYIPRALSINVKGFFQKNEISTILFSWFLAGWLLYEFSPSKLPTYVIAAHLPFAFMISLQLGNGLPFKTLFDKLFTSFHFLVQILLSIALCIVPYYLQLPQNLIVLLMALGLVLLAITVVILIKRNSVKLHYFQMVGALLFILFTWLIAPHITQLIDSSKSVAKVISIHEPDANHVFIGHNFGEQPSLPYYLLIKGYEISDVAHLDPSQLYEKTKELSLNVFILSKEQYAFFCEQAGHIIPHKLISSLIIDRTGSAEYYIVVNSDIVKQ
jgi:4-amino-4-deoxy-L-arabinose transferase-like glycosyltransferase